MVDVPSTFRSTEIERKAEPEKKVVRRVLQIWKEPTRAEWRPDNYRLLCGNLGNEVNDDVLSKAFSRFPTFNMAQLTSFSNKGLLQFMLMGCEKQADR
ncbi:uncharacterized protein [Nicotiana sylvestris]|uniref:uncharacterized protein n=1 Tax=Nicotiana sylvestris TaxID=4096 RepID=UPI00388C44B4